jgi:glycosyltransferase involved in cell wall biosynthesis
MNSATAPDISARARLRVCVTPGRDSDYNRALIEKLAPHIDEVPSIPDKAHLVNVDAPQLWRTTDVFHLGWPEHMFGNPGIEEAEFDRQVFAFIDALDRTDVRVVWTMHNRRPHTWEPERGRRLYRAWAPVADAVIHHSAWGMKTALAELPYRADARHVILPHGHFGDYMRVTRARPELEAEAGLAPCATRFGVLGRWQKEKQVEMILRAFEKGARADQQLVVTAYEEKTVRPGDPRIVFLPRKQQWMVREDIALSNHLCDVLVSAHTGDTYLTSGLIGDSIGKGQPMLVPHWEFFDETFGPHAFYHGNDEDSLARAFHDITPGDVERLKAEVLALQPRFDWAPIAEKTLALYRSLGGRAGGS